jgi:hypothetical protein
MHLAAGWFLYLCPSHPHKPALRLIQVHISLIFNSSSQSKRSSEKMKVIKDQLSFFILFCIPSILALPIRDKDLECVPPHHPPKWCFGTCSTCNSYTSLFTHSIGHYGSYFGYGNYGAYHLGGPGEADSGNIEQDTGGVEFEIVHVGELIWSH